MVKSAATKATVKDLAKEAGVSLATVDRVINGRSNVHAKTSKKVWEAAARINFERDINAANMARQKIYRFCFVLPTGTNTFFKSLRQACEYEAANYHDKRVQIDILTAPQLDNEKLLEALDVARTGGYDAIAAVTQDSPDIRAKLQEIAVSEIKIVNLISSIPTMEQKNFVGIDNAAAGRCAAELLCKFCRANDGKIGILLGSMILRDHLERRFGFEQKIRSSYPEREVVFIGECHDDRFEAEELVNRALKEHQNLAGIYSAGAGNKGVIAALEQSTQARQISVVAHELSAHARKALVDGVFDAVIAQDVGHEIRSAIRIMKAAVDRVKPDIQQNRIRTEVYIEGNLPETENFDQ